MAKKPLPTPDELRQLLRYEPETGKLFWLERTKEQMVNDRARGCFNTKFAGKEAGCVSHKGYRKVRLPNDVLYYAHRIIWAMQYDEWPAECIDHINHDGSDNRIENLRAVSAAENNRNSGWRSHNTTGYCGVQAHQTGRWSVSIAGKYIGLYQDIEDAASAARKAQRDMGFHKNHCR